MSFVTTARSEDLVPVRSRIAWPAVIAGSVLALSLYLLLALLGAALGFSISDKVSAQGLGTAAAVYAIAVTAVCLFIGGYVASQLTSGENKFEGVLYGVFVWATVFAMLLWLTVSGVRVGFTAMVGVATVGNVVDVPREEWEAAAERNGITKQQIEEAKQRAKAAPAQAKAATEDPQNQRAVAEAATRVTWYTFLGVCLSMMTAAAGGYFGSGPPPRLFAFWTEQRDHDKRAPTAHA